MARRHSNRALQKRADRQDDRLLALCDRLALRSIRRLGIVLSLVHVEELRRSLGSPVLPDGLTKIGEKDSTSFFTMRLVGCDIVIAYGTKNSSISNVFELADLERLGLGRS